MLCVILMSVKIPNVILLRRHSVQCHNVMCHSVEYHIAMSFFCGTMLFVIFLSQNAMHHSNKCHNNKC
jgi:hypothetical protein